LKENLVNETETIQPAKSLNKAYFNQSITGEPIEIFTAELQKAFRLLLLV
jgi:hypothetical protein